MTDLRRAVDTVLRDCLGTSAEEDVLVVTDPPRRGIAHALAAGARELGAEAAVMEMSERETHGSEPPRHVAAAMAASDVVIAATTKSISHTEGREAASQAGVRIASMPQITEDMLVRTMTADYGAIRRRSHRVASALTDASIVHVSTEKGTDVTLVVEGRRGMADDGDLRKPGAFGNLPAGEGYVAPVEGRAEGRVVFDGSMWPIGLLDEPLTVDIEEGYAVGFSGPRAGELRSLIEPYGRDAFAVAELGIGTNDRAKLTGNVLEDEKVVGTIHIAFGDNHSFGGRIRVASHQDGVVLEPSVIVDSETLMERGTLL